MKGFVNVAKGVYYLAPPVAEFGAGVTLVVGSKKFLIDCGAFDYSVTKFIVPALRALRIDIKDIDYLLFTHCDPDNMGGAHKFKQLSPDTMVMSYGYQTEILKNPLYSFNEKWSEFLDYGPPFRELHGVLANGTVHPEDSAFADLQPIFARGHSVDSVCWRHLSSGTLICGDAVQGNGTEQTGIAYITSLQYYKNTLLDLVESVPENMVCGRKFRDFGDVVIGRDNCLRAIEKSYECTNEYSMFVDKYARSMHQKRDSLDPEELAKAYFRDKKQPQYYGYAMNTFKEFLSDKRRG